MPKISVLLPIYNAEAHLEEAVKGILNQTYSDFELIAVDDGSTDQSLKILKRFQDPRLKILMNEKNLGISDSLNKAIAASQGQYLARMDQDDLALPCRFQKQIEFLEQHPEVDILGTWFKLFGNTIPQVIRHPTTDAAIKAGLIFEPVIGHPTVMMRKQSLMSLGHVYDPTYNRAEDFELWTRAACTLRLANLPEVLLHYRIHPTQMGSVSSVRQKEIADQVRANYLKQLGIHLTDASLQIHQIVAKGNFGKLQPADFPRASAYLSELRTAFAKNSSLSEALTQELNRQFTAQYFRNYFNFPVKNFIKANGLLDAGLVPISQKCFWMIRSVREYFN